MPNDDLPRLIPDLRAASLTQSPICSAEGDEMKRTISRRRLIGSSRVTIALPGLARAQGNDPGSQDPTDMRVSLIFGGMTMTGVLYDNPSARDFYSMLPVDLTIEDFSDNEKIVRLPRRLTEEASGPF